MCLYISGGIGSAAVSSPYQGFGNTQAQPGMLHSPSQPGKNLLDRNTKTCVAIGRAVLGRFILQAYGPPMI